MAKQLLDRKGVKFTEIRVDSDPGKREEMMKKKAGNERCHRFLLMTSQ
jgi:glutaredoxin